MGIVSFKPEDEQLEAVAVYADALTFVVHPKHVLAREKKVRIRDLGAENFIAHNVTSPRRKLVEESFAKHKTPLNIGVELPSLEAIKRFVASGNGVALVPALSVQAEIERGELVKVAVPELDCARQLWLVYRKQGTLSYAALAFLRVVRSLAVDRGAPFLYDEKSVGASKQLNR
jgi:DNA-binding transcriptional LysR family regulator